MKKTIVITIMLCAISVSVMAQKQQTKTTVNPTVSAINDLKQEVKASDSLTGKSLKAIENQLEDMYKVLNESFVIKNIANKSAEKPRYKMYQTENIYNLLKLDTRTGRVWQVQYGMKNVEAQVVSINYGIVFEIDGWDGRFELYPTKNFYNFIMLDTGTGNTYQVQWGTSSDYRFVREIY